MSTLPAERRVIEGRTFSAPWCPASYGAAIERPAPASHRLRQALVGFALAVAVVATLVLLHWSFRSQA